MGSDFLYRPTTPLQPGAAVAAILIAPDGQYGLQHRDPKPEIFFPDHWGCFGGGIENGEDEIIALQRELEEEIGLALASESFLRFTEFTFDFRFVPNGHVIPRAFYEIHLSESQIAAIKLGEGRAVGFFPIEQIFGALLLTPYDSFALWMYHSRPRFVFP